MGLNVHNHRLQSRSLCKPLTVLHLLTARGSNQHIHITRRAFVRANDTEIQTHFVQGERDVLVGLRLYLHLQFLIGHASRQADLFGDNCGRGQCKRHVFGACATFLDETTQGFSDFIKFFDVTVRNPAPLQGLDGAALKNQVSGLVVCQFDQLDTGGTDVNAHQRRGLAAEQSSHRNQDDSPSTHKNKATKLHISHGCYQ